MTAYSSKKISASLVKKGFLEIEDRADKKYYLTLDGKKVGIHTFVSHGTKEYGERLIGEMKKQLRLSKKEFIDLIDCPMTKEDYIQLLIKKGYIEK
jgi:hypothetical protein